MLYDPNRNKVMPHRSIARAHVANSVGGFRRHSNSTVVLCCGRFTCALLVGQGERTCRPVHGALTMYVVGASFEDPMCCLLSAFCWKMGDEWDRHGREATFVLIMRRGLAGSERFVMGDGRLVDFGGAGPSSTERQAARASWLRTVCCT
jgi:hypothetical protein